MRAGASTALTPEGKANCVPHSEEFSSEDEEDRRNPTSVRSLLKRIFAQVALLGEAATEAQSLATAIVESPSRGASGSTSEKPGEAAGRRGSHDPRCDDAAAGAGYSCPWCGHVFALRKTRELHGKVCDLRRGRQ